MPLSDKAKATFFSNKGKPVVGLIHRTTKEIVLAPCIPEKVSLQLNPEGEASSGTYITDHFVEDPTLHAEALEKVNALLKQHHVPRIAFTSTSPLEEKSAHQFLFKQQCLLTSSSEWGGFTVEVDASDRLSHTFVSGAFNSPRGTRIKGAELSRELAIEVKKQTSELGIALTDAEFQEDAFEISQTGTSSSGAFCCVTPPPKRQRVGTSDTGHVLSSHALFPPLAGLAKASASAHSSDSSLTMGLKK